MDAATELRIACFVMARNESAIILPFMDQLKEFFDEVMIVDHSSQDDTYDKIMASADSKFRILTLEAAGYPQSQLANIAATYFLSEGRADWLFFLDCDEYLPFPSKSELHKTLSSHNEQDFVYLKWTNIIPKDLDGGDIFRSGFRRSDIVTQYKKIAVNSVAYKRGTIPDIWQGYHGLSPEGVFSSTELDPRGLYHIPITSRAKFAYKVALSARKLKEDPDLVRRGLGSHWIKYYEEITLLGLSDFDYDRVAFFYSDPPQGEFNSWDLDFTFPYIDTPYAEDHADLIAGLSIPSVPPIDRSGHFRLLDDSGAEVYNSSAFSNTLHSQRKSDVRSLAGESKATNLSASELYSRFFSPLTHLPMEAASPARNTLFPVISAMIRTIAPASYLEFLDGCSSGYLYAASAAGKMRKGDFEAYGCLLRAKERLEDLSKIGSESGIDNIIRIFKDPSDLEADSPGRRFDLVNVSPDSLPAQDEASYDDVVNKIQSLVASDGVIIIQETSHYEKTQPGLHLYNALKSLGPHFEIKFGKGLGIIFRSEARYSATGWRSFVDDGNLFEIWSSLAHDLGSLIPGRLQVLNPK